MAEASVILNETFLPEYAKSYSVVKQNIIINITNEVNLQRQDNNIKTVFWTNKNSQLTIDQTLKYNKYVIETNWACIYSVTIYRQL